ncbi:MAG: phospho-sugar mutase [Propionibacteriaceae bacterium]|jgi:phosphomannomutase|nr:phospho-sugar mutase [Propionibacteriaceae bacterium]
MPEFDELCGKAAAWIAGDPDRHTREELSRLVEKAKTDVEALTVLADRFAGSLEFGTAGLRGVMAPGPNRMNRAVVIRAARGLIDYLNATLAAGQPLVVIGNDARYWSRQFAIDTAAVVTAAGGRALLLPDLLPTPVLAYAVRALNADAGVMVTASHNPAADNGYKVYLGGRCVADPQRGVQIVPPYDSQIAEAIAATPTAIDIPRADSGWTDLGPEIVELYTLSIAGSDGDESPQLFIDPVFGVQTSPQVCANAAAGDIDPPPSALIRIVHTAMHGVGSGIAREALRLAGFADVVSVAAQQQPDPDFPTVPFPNPEEPGAIDMALALADKVNADVVIANDPDADRCAVAVDDPRTGWRMLHGDELGAVLGEELAASISNPNPASGPVFASSIVSSRLLGQIAKAHGIRHTPTLTGFKWMGRVPGLAYAYEEAIGYCVRPDLVHDKDGLATAVLAARLVARLKAEGRTIIDLLDDLARQHGLYLTSQLSGRFSDLSLIPKTMAKLRQAPPSTLAGSRVCEVSDLADGYQGLPPTDGLVLTTGQNDRVIVRPSGTEPKVKCYLEVILPVDPDASFEALTQIRTTAKARLEEIKADLAAALF